MSTTTDTQKVEQQESAGQETTDNAFEALEPEVAPTAKSPDVESSAESSPEAGDSPTENFEESPFDDIEWEKRAARLQVREKLTTFFLQCGGLPKALHTALNELENSAGFLIDDAGDLLACDSLGMPLVDEHGNQMSALDVVAQFMYKNDYLKESNYQGPELIEVEFDFDGEMKRLGGSRVGRLALARKTFGEGESQQPEMLQQESASSYVTRRRKELSTAASTAGESPDLSTRQARLDAARNLRK